MIRWSCLAGLAATLVAGCRSGETAIVIEVAQGTIDPATLDEVVIQVSGRGIDGGEALARAPLRGSEARTFPLTLALRGTAEASGPFLVEAEGHREGTVRARARADGPVSFEDGKVVRRRLVLAAIDQPDVPDAGAPPDAMAEHDAPGADTAVAPGDAAVPPAAEAGPPDASASAPDARERDAGERADARDAATAGPDAATAKPDAAAGGPDARDAAPAPGGGCEACDQDCTIVNLLLGTCVPAPDGTACHGGSGMTCHRCLCGK